MKVNEMDVLQLREAIATEIFEQNVARLNASYEYDYGGDTYADPNPEGKLILPFIVEHYDDEEDLRLSYSEVEHYEEDVEAAWSIVEKLWHHFWPTGSGGPRLECTIYPDFDGWHCDVTMEAVGILISSAVEETMPLAVCKAALEAVRDAKGE